jgi:hypothetical protein
MSSGSAGLKALSAGRTWPVASLMLGLALLCALMLALPGQTVATRYLNDLFLILDHAYRISWGQAPNQDFHTPLGPLASYVPALGYRLSGSLGAAMPLGMALVLLGLAPAIAYVLASRLHPVLALSYGAFLILVLAVPINLGEGINALTFAKFYNRIGWAALGALLILYLRPRSGPNSGALDGSCAALLALVLIYTKATYGVAALGFLTLMLLDRRQRGWALGALGGIAVVVLIVEFFWRSSLAHLADLQMALAVSGALRGSWGQILDHILVSLADYVLVALFAVLALRRSRRLRDALFYLYCAVVGFLLINQNFQSWGILTLHAAAAVAAETILRHTDDAIVTPERERWTAAAGAKLLFLALVLPTIVHCTLALGLHTMAAANRAGDPIPFASLNGVRFANLWSWGDHSGGLDELKAVSDGAAALAALSPRAERVAVLGVANPFSSALGLRPPRGDLPWLLWERTVGPAAASRAAAFLSDVAVVLEPKHQPDSDAARADKEGRSPAAFFHPVLTSQFEVVRETDHWIVHRRRQPIRTGCRDCGEAPPRLAGLP